VVEGDPQRGKRPLRTVQPGRIRALRLAAGYTQRGLAKALGVSSQAVWLLDNDRRQPSAAMMRKLRRVLDRVPQPQEPQPLDEEPQTLGS
jgi:transcriptional regulator with XRE-family HTH domain